MDAKAKAFLFDLLKTPSPTGFELGGQRVWAKYVRQFADRVENDAYGTAWATIKGSGKNPRRVMIEAHADEIGFIIKHIPPSTSARTTPTKRFPRFTNSTSMSAPAAKRT
jgi:putative aminopeptidase FrvX